MRDKPVKTTCSRAMAAACAAAVLMLASVLAGPAQAVRDFSEDEYRMFGGFYYDSFFAVSDMLADAGMPESLEAFKRAPESLQLELCPVIVSHAIFRSSVVRAFFRPEFNKKWVNLLTLRIVFDEAGVEWSPLSDVTPEDQPAVLRASEDVKQFLKQREDWLSERHRYCLDNHAVAIGLVATNELVSAYAPVPLEFRLRDFYESQAPFLAWVVAYLRENESRLTPENLQELAELEGLIESIERKYGR